MTKINKNKGFTLLEILLVIAAIGILAAIVLVAINPNRQIAQARNTVRQSDINTIQKALEQYLIEKGRYPNSVSTTPGYICNTGTEQNVVTTNCNERVDLRELVPDYIAAIPKDPQSTGTNTGYIVATNPDNNKVSIQASLSERGILVINPLNIVKDGLVLHLDAGNPASYPGTGTTWTDLSGNGNNGSLTPSIGGPNFSSSSGGSFSFNHTDLDYVSFSSSSSLQFLNRLSYTLEAWVYPTRNPGRNNWTGIFDRESNSGSGRDGYNLYFLGSDGTDTYFFTERFTSGSYNAVPVTLNQSESVNNWHHVVGTYDGTTLSLYRNGSLVGTPKTTTGDVTNTSKSLTIGVRGGQYFGGNISNAKIYTRALTPAEIQQNFNATRGRFGL